MALTKDDIQFTRRLVQRFESAVRDHALRHEVSQQERNLFVSEYNRVRKQLYKQLDSLEDGISNATTPDEVR